MIRIGVRNKGCAGLSYHLEYVEKPSKFDEVVQQDGVKVVIDSKALFSIIGSEMDWKEDGLTCVAFQWCLLPLTHLGLIGTALSPHSRTRTSRMRAAVENPSPLARNPQLAIPRPSLTIWTRTCTTISSPARPFTADRTLAFCIRSVMSLYVPGSLPWMTLSFDTVLCRTDLSCFSLQQRLTHP